MKDEVLYMVMPTYNEEKNIRELVKEWYPKIKDKSEQSRMVVADGGSKDNTFKILKSLQKDYPKLEVISKPGTDHGTKVIFLYDYALKNGADYIFQTDSDRQTDPKEFDQFWELRHKYDAILGNRVKRGDGKGRKFVEDVLRLMLLLYFNARTPDSGAPFRLMKRTIIEKYLHLMPMDYDLPNAFFSACFSRNKENHQFRHRNRRNYLK